MKYAIYPPIGFARLGNSPDEFFVGPETPGAPGKELLPDGREQDVTRYKDAGYRMKRQGARFHLFELPDGGGEPRPATLSADAAVRWRVTLANKKDAVVRPSAPPEWPTKVRVDPARRDRLIQATAEVRGASATPRALEGVYRAAPDRTTRVRLGDLRTDASQRLIVLGGIGRSETLVGAPIGGSFYNNPDWFDDVGDGPVTATVELPGAAPVEATPAWVVVGPPDFAPHTLGVVTLRDVIREVAIRSGWLPRPVSPVFEADIRPLIERARGLRHVDRTAAWGQVSQDWPRLSSAAPADRALRLDTRRLIATVEDALQGFELQGWQHDALDAWVNGQFTAGVAPSSSRPAELTRAALDGTVGQGFEPGIEAGINLTDPSLYIHTPFEYRLDTAMVEAGDVTALMALPWQADFLKCSRGWWPTQRPDRAPQAAGADREWLRPTMSHRQLVDDVMKLGVISPDAAGAVVEQGRHPSLPG